MILLVVTREARGSSGWQPKENSIFEWVMVDILRKTNLKAYTWSFWQDWHEMPTVHGQQRPFSTAEEVFF